MLTINYITEARNNGLLCDEYYEKVNGSKSKKDLFRICADANGFKWLPQLSLKGHELPYDVIEDEFGAYINGKYKPEYEKDGISFSSAIYCRYDQEVILDTQLACFLGCRCRITVADYNIAKISVDDKSDIEIYCPPTSAIEVLEYGDATIKYPKDSKNIKIVSQ